MRSMLIMILMMLSSSLAHAAFITLERTGTSVDFPHLTVFNDDPLAIQSLSLTIGEQSKNYDSSQIQSISPGMDAFLLNPDDVNNVIRSDILEYSFLNFSPGNEMRTRLDIDADSGPATQDWQTILFNNGSHPNALLTIDWIGGSTSSIVFHDEPGRNPLDPYIVSLPHSIPEPSSLLLLVPVVCGGIAYHFKRRRS